MRHHVTLSAFERWRPSTSLRRVSGGTFSRKNDRTSSRNACSSFVNARSIGSSCFLVVLAKARTHYHRPSLLTKAIAICSPHSGCGVWVPAFAGTTVTGRLLQHLQKPRRAHAAADAEWVARLLRFAATAFDQSVAGEARARHAVGMAHRDRAAVDIDLVGVDAELVPAIQHLHRESFVQLPQADVVDGQAITLEQARHGEYRADAHLVRLAPGGDEAAEDAERVQPALRGFLVAHDHARAGAVRKLAGIAGGDRKSLAAHGLEAGETFSGGLGARALVLRERDFLERDCSGRLVGHLHPGGDRRELVLELAALLGRGRAALAL